MPRTQPRGARQRPLLASRLDRPGARSPVCMWGGRAGTREAEPRPGADPEARRLGGATPARDGGGSAPRLPPCKVWVAGLRAQCGGWVGLGCPRGRHPSEA